MIKFGAQLTIPHLSEDVKVSHNQATRELYLGEMIDKTKKSLERAIAKVEKMKAEIEILEEKRNVK